MGRKTVPPTFADDVEVEGEEEEYERDNGSIGLTAIDILLDNESGISIGSCTH